MNKKIIIMILVFILPFFANGCARGKVKVKKDGNDYSLSINASNIMLGEIIKELIEKCKISVVIHGETISSRLIKVKFKELSLEQGIKKLMSAAGIKKYVIKYGENGSYKSEVRKLILWDGSEKAEKELIKTEKKEYGVAEDALPKDLESFKTRYEWEDEETRELAGYLIEFMPNPTKYPGMKELARELDKRIKDGEKGKVDEKMFYQALESIVPPSVAPMMMASIKEHAQEYKSGERSSEITHESAQELHQKYFIKQ
jgi:hypothetical protein